MEIPSDPFCRFHVRHVHLLFNRVAFIALLLLLRHQLLIKPENFTYSVIILAPFPLLSIITYIVNECAFREICRTRIYLGLFDYFIHLESLSLSL